MKQSDRKASKAEAPSERLADLHLKWGWWSLLGFLSLGMLLELFNGIKADLYLNVANQTRREMWTLAHAHGTLLALVNIAFSYTVGRAGNWTSKNRELASRYLLVAAMAIPGGFFLGGFFARGGDPGLGILLVPVGGVALFVAVFSTARALMGASTGPR